MKPYVAILCISIASAVSAAEPTDTIPEHEVNLQEVTVKAAPVVRKSDRDLFIPSADTRKRSSNGLDLLSNMQIPTISVNTVMNSITKGADAVEVRINGRKSDIDQVRALSPENIIRVEYHDNPELRYDGSAAVLDFIVRNPNRGGSFSSYILQTLTKKFGNQSLSLRLNDKRSQWSFSYSGYLRLDLPVYRENIENFTLDDGSTINRTESPLGGAVNQYRPTFRAEYNYIKTDTTNFYVGLSFSRSTSERLEYNSILHSDNSTTDILIHDAQSGPNTQPGINLYLSHKIGRRQTLVFDINTSYYIGSSIRDYTESNFDTHEPVVNIDSRIREHNFAITAEGDYIREWNHSQLTAGVRYTANRNRSDYILLDDAVYHQNKDRIYFFSEYLHRIGSLTLSAGIGGEYNNIYSSEADTREERFLFQPRFTAAYSIDDHSQLRFIFRSYTSTPSLSQMSPVRQNIDGIQASVGNPNLKPYNNYKLSLQYNYSFGRVMGQIATSFVRVPQAIMDYRYIDSGYIISSYANQPGSTGWGASISPRVTIIPEWLSFNGQLAFSRYYLHGIDYRHYYTGVSGYAAVSAYHWGFSLNADYNSGSRSLWGETINRGECFSTIAIGYQYRGWTFSAGVFMPFGHYSQGTETISRYAHIKRTMRTKAIECLTFVSFTYNVAWGRKARNATRLINNDSGVQSSSTAGK